MCHAADDADSGGRERISTVRNIHGKKACYRACKAENGGKGLPLKMERKNTRRREMERTSLDGRK